VGAAGEGISRSGRLKGRPAPPGRWPGARCGPAPERWDLTRCREGAGSGSHLICGREPRLATTLLQAIRGGCGEAPPDRGAPERMRRAAPPPPAPARTPDGVFSHPSPPTGQGAGQAVHRTDGSPPPAASPSTSSRRRRCPAGVIAAGAEPVCIRASRPTPTERARLRRIGAWRCPHRPGWRGPRRDQKPTARAISTLLITHHIGGFEQGGYLSGLSSPS